MVSSRPLPVDRLTELVAALTDVDGTRAEAAVAAAVGRHGNWGDGLLNVADAIITLRHDGRAGVRVPVGSQS